MNIIPKRTADEWPDTITHGSPVVAWHDGMKQFVEADPKEVRERKRIFSHWHINRRKNKR